VNSILKGLNIKGSYNDRSVFLEGGSDRFSPPIISKSHFVSNKMAEHLMKNKKYLALGVKYQYGDLITNMEGALHTFVTPISNIFLTETTSLSMDILRLLWMESEKLCIIISCSTRF
jgi:hypothetical protein